MKKLLIVTHHILSGNSGGAYASKAYIKALVEIADQITLLYPIKTDNDIQIDFLDKEITKLPIAYRKNKILKFIDLFKGHIHRYYRIFQNIISNDNFDVVVFDTSLVSFGLIDIAHKYGCKVITIHHNYQIEYYKDNTQFWLRPFYLFWVRRCELEAVQKSDFNLTLTLSDKELLYKHYDNKRTKFIDVIGCFNITPIHYNRNIMRNTNCINKHRFVITGGLSDIQTEKSLKIWILRYYPILKKVFHDSEVIIAGKSPSVNLCNICKKNGITLIPSPLNMQEILDKANYYLCPISLGGGMKLRIMDGLKNGLPVIAHGISIRGYEVFLNDDVLLSYNDFETFEKALINLKNNRYDSEFIKNKYKSSFSFESGVNRFKQLLIGI